MRALSQLTLLIAAAAPTAAFAAEFTYDNLRRSMYYVLATILQLAGLAAVAAVVYYGIRMAVSRGDSAKFSEAKKGLLYALLGAAVIFGVYTILATVRGATDELTGGRGASQQENVLQPAIERSKDR